MYTRWTEDAAAALESPVTEVAFYTLPDGSGEEERITILKAMEPLGPVFKEFGNMLGSAIGWSKLICHVVTLKPDVEQLLR